VIIGRFSNDVILADCCAGQKHYWQLLLVEAGVAMIAPPWACVQVQKACDHVRCRVAPE
jgi:hypothetical protein